MFINQWKKDILTIPNFLSMIRLILIPVYISIYMNATEQREFFIAGAILIVSCITDMIDGQIARRFHMISNVGKVLDPLADKLTQLALSLCLSLRYPVIRWVLVCFLAKEVFQAITALIMFRNGKVLPGAIPAGKICTTVLFVSFITLVLIPDMDAAPVRAIALADSLFLLYAFVSYVFAFYGKNAKLQDFNP